MGFALPRHLRALAFGLIWLMAPVCASQAFDIGAFKDCVGRGLRGLDYKEANFDAAMEAIRRAAEDGTPLDPAILKTNEGKTALFEFVHPGAGIAGAFADAGMIRHLRLALQIREINPQGDLSSSAQIDALTDLYLKVHESTSSPKALRLVTEGLHLVTKPYVTLPAKIARARVEAIITSQNAVDALDSLGIVSRRDPKLVALMEKYPGLSKIMLGVYGNYVTLAHYGVPAYFPRPSTAVAARLLNLSPEARAKLDYTAGLLVGSWNRLIIPAIVARLYADYHPDYHPKDQKRGPASPTMWRADDMITQDIKAVHKFSGKWPDPASPDVQTKIQEIAVSVHSTQQVNANLPETAPSPEEIRAIETEYRVILKRLRTSSP